MVQNVHLKGTKSRPWNDLIIPHSSAVEPKMESPMLCRILQLVCSIALISISFESWAIGESRKFSDIPELATEEFCYSEYHSFEDWNVVEVHSVDLNSNSVDELLILRQGNNFAEYHLFFKDDCGFKAVTNEEGGELTVLYYSSSVICQPIGCLEGAYCQDAGLERFFIVVSGRHTLSNEEAWAWRDGKLPDDEVRSEVIRSKYKLIDGKAQKHKVDSWSDVKKNMGLFKAIGEIDIASCS